MTGTERSSDLGEKQEEKMYWTKIGLFIFICRAGILKCVV